MSTKTEKATFAAGCFWHVQQTFDQVQGVISTTVGYTDGQGIPSYDSAEAKGFNEAIEIIFDPSEINFPELLEYFWEEHDPTTLGRQGADVGKRYRSVIYYHSEEQRKQAHESMEKLQKTLDKKIVTELKPAGKFFLAEEYHQKYFEKNH